MPSLSQMLSTQATHIAPKNIFALIGRFASTVAKNEFSVKAFSSSFHLIRNGNRTKWSNSVCNHTSDYFASSEKKKPSKRARDGAYCPIT